MIAKTSIKTLIIPAGALGASHTGANNATVMTDATATFTPNALVGLTINNTSTGAYGVIIANGVTTVTVAALSAGIWTTGDNYTITINVVGALYIPFGELEKVTDAVVSFDEEFAAGLALGVVTTLLPLTGLNTAPSATVLTDALLALVVNSLVGLVVRNVTDGSSGVITANATNTVTVVALTGGTLNTWTAGDAYFIGDVGAAVAVVVEEQAVPGGAWTAAAIAGIAGCKFTVVAKGE